MPSEHGSPVVLISDRLWKTALSGDPGAVGSAIVLDGRPYTIVGIAAPDFALPDERMDVWTPARYAATLGVDWITNPRGGGFNLIARLKEGVTLDGARAAADAIARTSEFRPVVQSLTAAVHAKKGVAPDHVLTALVDFGGHPRAAAADDRPVVARILDRLQSDPRVIAASVSTSLPPSVTRARIGFSAPGPNGAPADHMADLVPSSPDLFRTLDVPFLSAIDRPAFRTLMVGGMAAISILLTLVGMTGVLACPVSQRTREIGVRLALGASTPAIRAMVVGEAARVGVAGIATGLAAAFVLSRLLATELYGVSTSDPLSFAAAALLVSLITLTASYFPARRASIVDPVVALRSE